MTLAFLMSKNWALTPVSMTPFYKLLYVIVSEPIAQLPDVCLEKCDDTLLQSDRLLHRQF